MDHAVKLEGMIVNLNGWALDREAFLRISELVPRGGTILELGSGEGSQILCKMGYQVYSVEHDMAYYQKALALEFLGQIIIARLVDGWYDPDIIKRYSPVSYDLLIVDGPVGSEARIHLMKHLHLFRHDIPWLIDDTHRPHEAKMAEVIARELDFHLEAIETTNEIGKQFCILTPKTRGGTQ